MGQKMTLRLTAKIYKRIYNPIVPSIKITLKNRKYIAPQG